MAARLGGGVEIEVVSHGHRLSYLTAGEGEPLVLIPGLMQAAVDWVDAGYPALLGDLFRVIIIDPLGFGASDKPHTSADYTFTREQTTWRPFSTRSESMPRTCGATRWER